MRDGVQSARAAGASAVLALGLLSGLLASCGGGQDSYCDAVRAHQRRLGELIGSSDPDALLQALPTFRDLQDKAPGDVADEWQEVVGSVEGFADAIRAAGADPKTYDPSDPPSGVTTSEQRAIAVAADRLVSSETLAAMKDLDQQARDVCHTPLSL